MASRDEGKPPIRVARILGAHGIRGDVKLRSFMSEGPDVACHGPLQTASGQTVEIVRLKPQARDFIASLKGVSDRGVAESLKGVDLYLPRDRLPEPAEGEVYAADLIGLPVLDKDGERLGEIAGVPNFGAGDLLEIRMEGRQGMVLVPFARPYLVERSSERLVIDLPEGYLDEEK